MSTVARRYKSRPSIAILSGGDSRRKVKGMKDDAGMRLANPPHPGAFVKSEIIGPLLAMTGTDCFPIARDGLFGSRSLIGFLIGLENNILLVRSPFS